MSQTCSSPIPVGSSGCTSLNCDADTKAETAGPATTPSVTQNHAGRGVTASTDIKIAPPRATNGMPSTPAGTHSADTVDLAMVTASANTRMAVHTVDAGTAARVRCHATPGIAVSSKRPLGDT